MFAVCVIQNLIEYGVSGNKNQFSFFFIIDMIFVILQRKGFLYISNVDNVIFGLEQDFFLSHSSSSSYVSIAVDFFENL